MIILASTSWSDFLSAHFKRRIFRKVTSRSLKLFLRGGDFISYSPLVEGVHEKSLTNLIRHFSDNQFSDYLIDIGANIGLTSCQNGSSFKKVICFEPNPLCANILKTNLAISLQKDKFEVNEFALGDSEGAFELYIPKHNWGGAFVRSESNGYSDEVLALKDGFDDIELDNYVVSLVEVKSTEDIITDIFSNFKQQGLKKGVIKIDVEGFERVVLRGIAKSLPADFAVVIVFENWDENFDFAELRDSFSARKISLGKIEKGFVEARHSKLYKLFSLMFGGSDKQYLGKLDDANSVVGDIVVEVSESR